MLARVRSGALIGIDAVLVEVEVDMALGLPFFNLVGLPEGAVKESKVRVLSAIKNAGFDLPQKRITANLAPADIRKDGAAFDLPIALAVLAAAGRIEEKAMSKLLFAGELALDGIVKPIKGALPLAVAARDAGLSGIVVPQHNAREAAVVDGLQVIGVSHFKEVLDHVEGHSAVSVTPHALPAFGTSGEGVPDFSDVRGQEHVKRAVEVAAAGGHNALLIGPPGSGKTMIAKRLPGILPQMSFPESLETTKIYSVMGLVPADRSLVTERPFRAPHHTISDAGLIGGGPVPRPGEVSLAHNGVLFLDELPEFRRNVLEVLRQPLEDGSVTIARAALSLTYPARSMLVAAMNPCPCGHLGDSQRACVCQLQSVQRYRARVSGPLLDRIDIHVEVPAVRFRELSSRQDGESSESIRARVDSARVRQRHRFRKHVGIHCNAQMTPRLIRRFCPLDADSEKLMAAVVDRLGMSARAYDRILRLARTIADLAASDGITTQHVAEAIQYRTLDRKLA